MEKKPQDECNTQCDKTRALEKENEVTNDCMQIDDIIGGFGKYQFLIFLFKILIGATSAFNNLGVTFFAPTDFISYQCTGVSGSSVSTTTLPTTTLATILPVNATILTSLNTTIGFDLANRTTYVEFPKTELYSGRNQTLDAASFDYGDSQKSFGDLLSDFVFSDERKYKHSLNLNSDTPKGLRKECTYLSPDDNKQHKCTSYEYNTGIWIKTIIDEWDLVCDRAWYISVTQSLYMFGFVISYLMFGYISDRFGRWNSLLLGALIEILSGFGCAFATSITQFMIFRLLLGLGCAGRSSSCYLIMIEWTGIRWRMHISTLGSIGWAMGYCMMPWMALYFLHFRHMQLFICFYEIVFLICLLCLPESPRWLLTHKRFDEAREVLMTAARFNGLILKNNQDQLESSSHKKEKFIANSSTGNLVMDEYSKSSQGSDTSNFVTAESHFSTSITLSASEQFTDKRRSMAEDDSDQANHQDHQTGLDKSSLAITAGACDKDPSKVDSARTERIGYFSILSSSCGDWFCGEGQSRELPPYTEDEFEIKFKALKHVIEAKEFTKNEDNLSIIDLFKWKNLRKYTFILAFAWAANSFIYYGIALRVGDFGGKNLFVAFTFAGATEIPSLAFTMVCMKVLPRKTTNVFLFSIILVLCVLQLPLRYYDCQWLQQMTMMLAKLFNACTFSCILYQTMELFPTSIRQTAFSSCSLAGRIGSILAPFIKELQNVTNIFVPPIIYAVLTIFEIIFIKHLPETQGSELPDTLLEAESFKGTDVVEEKKKANQTIKEDVEKGVIDRP